ncbi:MAG: phage major capsid protein, partial [Elusimicrobium sp.]|nr:phage major capsid protein [Elusimicrobium sp.]
MDEIMQSIKELRKTLENKIDSCITKEKAENIVTDIINNLHPAQRKAVVPSSADEVLERFAEFSKSSKNAPETPWTSEYGRKFGGMKNFLLAAKDRNFFAENGKAVLSESGVSGGGYLVPSDFSNTVARIMGEISPVMQIANVMPMGSWKRQLPKQTANLTVGWVAENGIRGVTNPAFGQIEQVAKVLATV